ncbi:MAG: hypothetical protein OEZ02_01110 [Anaerolineae bacterium]|nr:hypothetical protein [Anaerolineae bacterium]
MAASNLRRKAGNLALILMVMVTSFWAFWGAAEFYYEAWGLPFPEPLFYLIPFVITLSLTLAAMKWPRLGGWVIIILGAAFTFFVMAPRITSDRLTLQAFLSWFPLTFLLLALGWLFIWGGPTAFQSAPEANELPFWRRHWQRVLALGLPVLIILGISARMLPFVLARHDDGERGARLISGSGLALVWAPAGPGWNWKQPWGGYPSWNALAWYGMAPVGLKTGDQLPDGYASQNDMDRTGLCRYLDSSGLNLMSEPQNVWRMPSTAEIVAALSYRGDNAGCSWTGDLGIAACTHTPDKETPLWAPDQSPIYMWSGEQYDNVEAYYVSYNGRVQAQPKSWGNPRHGYRCVREAEAG